MKHSTFNIFPDDVQGHVEYSEVDDPQYFSSERKGWYSYIKDQVGTIMRVYKHETKQIINTRSYDTFGKLVYQAGTLKGNLGYQSKYYDQESGLNYFYHRYYYPSIGRFINEDPIGLQGGLNLFGFEYNNSINFADQYGLFTEFTLPGQKIKPGWNNIYKNGIGGLIPPMIWPEGNFKLPWFDDIIKWTLKGVIKDIIKIASFNTCCFLNCMTDDVTILNDLLVTCLSNAAVIAIEFYYPLAGTFITGAKISGGLSFIYMAIRISDKIKHCIKICK
jgi:RHS repeat-associated protein